jgi:hypothetical protein
VHDPSFPASFEFVYVTLKSYFKTPASEPKLTDPDDVQEAIRDFKFGPGPEPYPEQGLKASPTASGFPPGPDF